MRPCLSMHPLHVSSLLAGVTSFSQSGSCDTCHNYPSEGLWKKWSKVLYVPKDVSFSLKMGQGGFVYPFSISLGTQRGRAAM